ncbi:allose kinase [Martelella alba]|uniref:Allose kinase n=1 Tax=Martelella alba TaxID=2590451 RepID=A0ABY2SJ44_9HYPH|nr:allose kinase [Martelella alba]TKI05458.1 allose kinase [Martelella alba]
MHNRQKVVVGVDMGATHIRICLLGDDGQLVATDKNRTDTVIAKGLARGLSQFIQDRLAGYATEMTALMIGFPAAVARDRKTIISVPNLPCDTGEFSYLADRLMQQFHCPVAFERDVNLQLYYDVTEQRLADKLVLGCYLGTGFGFAVWLNGALFVGAHGVAGELGHIPLGDPDIRCGCGNDGCLETLCSGAALARWYGREPRGYALSDVFVENRREPVLDEFIRLGAKAIATSANLFDPDCILLGGGVMDMAGFPYERLVAQTRRHLRKPLPAEILAFAKASSSSFNGAIGAARMAGKTRPL